MSVAPPTAARLPEDIPHRIGDSEAQEGRDSVADLLKLLPFAPFEDKAVMERLEPSGFSHGNPAICSRVDPFGQVPMHLRENRVRRSVWIQAAPLVSASTGPQGLWERVAERARL